MYLFSESQFESSFYSDFLFVKCIIRAKNVGYPLAFLVFWRLLSPTNFYFRNYKSYKKLHRLVFGSWWIEKKKRKDASAEKPGG
jgi:hypothetical protein